MRRLLTSVALSVVPFALAACASSGVYQRNAGPEGSVTGVVKLPDGVSPASACEQFSVVATDANGNRVGDPSIHTGASRCSYSIDGVPANAPVTLAVAGGSSVCSQGKLAIGSQSAVKVQPYETKLIDLSATCTQ